MSRELKKCQQCGRAIYFEGICVSCEAENRRKAILDLSQEEVTEKIATIYSTIERKADFDVVYDLCQKLINYRDINTAQLAEVAWSNKMFHCPALYKDASESVIKEMIDCLMNDELNSRLAGSLLLCLAEAGGEEVFQAFLTIEKNPRKWRKKLYVNPSFYATYGGWSYDSNEEFVKTSFDKCYPMVKGSLVTKEQSPVKIGTETNEICPQCGCQIVNLLEIDGYASRLDFLGINGIVKVKCCLNCIAYNDESFYHYDLNGKSQKLSDGNGQIENYIRIEEIHELASNTYILGSESVPLRYAASWEGGSAIGGFAFWIQDCEIKQCPDCGKPMKYLAQVQLDQVIDGMEGNAYIEVCQDCKTLAILHQQT